MTAIQRAFAPFKRYLPGFVWAPIRRVGTAIFTPLVFSYKRGHFRSSLKALATDRRGKPIPWYSYPAIDFLKNRGYADRSVLEFGSGQSTLWWAQRAQHVLSIEEDPAWYERMRAQLPSNVELHLAPFKNAEECRARVSQLLAARSGKYDVVIIDGLARYELIEMAIAAVKDDGIIVCDNSEGYGFQQGFARSGLMRVDFFGMVPGVILPHCTSVFFRDGSFAFAAAHPIPVQALED